MAIRPGTATDIPECARLLSDCKLAEAYFSDPAYLNDFIEEAASRNEFFVISSPETGVAGFMRIDPRGMFSRFPLLRLIAVKPDHRGKGYGSTMLRHFEDMFLRDAGKLFLLVSETNHEARRLYETFGYRMIGRIPDLYKAGIEELIMMKQSVAAGS